MELWYEAVREMMKVFLSSYNGPQGKDIWLELEDISETIQILVSYSPHEVVHEMMKIFLLSYNSPQGKAMTLRNIVSAMIQIVLFPIKSTRKLYYDMK